MNDETMSVPEQVQATTEVILETCLECRTSYTPPADLAALQDSPWFIQRGLCSETCGERWLDSKLKDSGLPVRYRRMTLAGFDPYVSTLRDKLYRAWTWVRSNPGVGLFLSGAVGSGKTHLAAGAMREMCRRGLRTAYTHSFQFVAGCQAATSQGRALADIVCASLRDGVDVLVLDDMGAEITEDVGYHSIAFLIEICYARDINLIATSNLSLGQVYELCPRVGSRLAEMVDELQFPEADYRLQLAQRRERQRETVNGGRVN